MSDDPVLIHLANAQAAGQRYGIDPADILAILSVEGGTDAHGHPVAPGDGAGPPSFGQFTFGTGASLGIDYGNSKSETFGIARYLQQLGYRRDRRTAIAAYNGGPGNPQYTYAAKVTAAAGRYRDAKASPVDAPATEDASARADTGGLFGDRERSGLLRALTYATLAISGAVLVGLGLTRTTGLRSA